MAEKFYHICGRAYDDDGKMHIVTVVGKVKQGSEKVDVKLDTDYIPIFVDRNGHEVKTNDISINFKEKRFSRELEIGAVPVRPSPRLFDAGDDPGGLILLFISLILKHFSIIPCIFQKKSVSLQKISGARQYESKLSLHSLA